jgi:hypothetical protein
MPYAFVAVFLLLLYIIYTQEKQMATITDLNAAIDAIQTSVSTLSADITAVLDILKSGGDLQPAIDKLTAIKASLDADDASLKAVE